ncbi:hypothetical protein MKZ38_005081 [Zalerion maritima]|uniref:Uncharacterized protein n=1 Tax=Zalerion maritima TaxID=339359 RepID=A0AAD5RL29_9PEZI|nr:hypothetical protein MKZ38_005081 [Zalerion maritima]
MATLTFDKEGDRFVFNYGTEGDSREDARFSKTTSQALRCVTLAQTYIEDVGGTGRYSAASSKGPDRQFGSKASNLGLAKVQVQLLEIVALGENGESGGPNNKENTARGDHYDPLFEVDEASDGQDTSSQSHGGASGSIGAHTEREAVGFGGNSGNHYNKRGRGNENNGGGRGNGGKKPRVPREDDPQDPHFEPPKHTLVISFFIVGLFFLPAAVGPERTPVTSISAVHICSSHTPPAEPRPPQRGQFENGSGKCKAEGCAGECQEKSGGGMESLLLEGLETAGIPDDAYDKLTRLSDMAIDVKGELC